MGRKRGKMTEHFDMDEYTSGFSFEDHIESVGYWLDSRIDIQDNPPINKWVSARQLYTNFREYAKLLGYPIPYYSVWGRTMSLMGYSSFHTKKGKIYKGFSFKRK